MASLKKFDKKTHFPILATIILVILIINTIRAIINLEASQGRIESVKIQIADMAAKNAEIRKDIQYVQSNEYLEKAALEQLKLTKSGHHILIIDEKYLIEDQNTEDQLIELHNYELWLKEFNLLK